MVASDEAGLGDRRSRGRARRQCELVQAAGEVVVDRNGVKIVGHPNRRPRWRRTPSALYAKNLFSFLETFWDKDAGARRSMGRRSSRRRC
jgi:NAD/NADP transhydrogenase alpha subunit